MNIKIHQQIGYKTDSRGRQHKQVYDIAKVYDGEGDEREYLGMVGRSEQGGFTPRRDFTDGEQKEILDAINAERAARGVGPLKKFGSRPLSIAETNARLAQFQPAADEDEDE